MRDPRDNFLSHRKKREDWLTLQKFVFNWKVSTNIALNSGEKDYLMLKYEDLTGNPERVLKRLCDFLKIEYNETLLRPTRNGIVWTGNSMFGDNKGKIHSSAVKRYKKFMSRDETELIESYLYDEMRKLGYEIQYAKMRNELPLSYRAARMFGLKSELLYKRYHSIF